MRTKEEVEKIVEELGYIYIEDYYKDKKHRKVIVQDQIGYKYNVSINSIMNNQGINFVDKANPFTLSWNIPLWLKLNNSQFQLMDGNTYFGNRTKLRLYCKKCKDYPSISWNHIYQEKQGCPICRGFQVGLYHNLEVQRPDIAKEWHPTKNGKLTPRDVTFATNKKVWWICPNGHEYFSSINNRTSKKGAGCKTCADSQKESTIATKLKNYILSKYKAKEEYSIFINPETNRPLPYDIYIFTGKDPKLNGVYIEIHGTQHFIFTRLWHKTKEEFEYQKHKDRLKRKFARKNGVYIEIDLRKIKTSEEAIDYLNIKFGL